MELLAFCVPTQNIILRNRTASIKIDSLPLGCDIFILDLLSSKSYGPCKVDQNQTFYNQ